LKRTLAPGSLSLARISMPPEYPLSGLNWRA
jgi:hypothetical protein